jgi:hypothetical protein
MAFLALFFRESRKQMCLQPYSGVYSIETSMLAEDGGGDLCQLRRWWLWSAAALLLLSAAVLYVSFGLSHRNRVTIGDLHLPETQHAWRTKKTHGHCPWVW